MVTRDHYWISAPFSHNYNTRFSGETSVGVVKYQLFSHVTHLVCYCAKCEVYFVFVIPQAAPNDIQRLWTAIDRRIQALKRGQEKEKAADQDHTADDDDESKTEPDDELKGTEQEDDDDSVKDRCEVPDEGSNDSCPTTEARGNEGNETAADDD